jgi:hypothetical protein
VSAVSAVLFCAGRQGTTGRVTVGWSVVLARVTCFRPRRFLLQVGDDCVLGTEISPKDRVAGLCGFQRVAVEIWLSKWLRGAPKCSTTSKGVCVSSTSIHPTSSLASLTLSLPDWYASLHLD